MCSDAKIRFAASGAKTDLRICADEKELSKLGSNVCFEELEAALGVVDGATHLQASMTSRTCMCIACARILPLVKLSAMPPATLQSGSPPSECYDTKPCTRKFRESHQCREVPGPMGVSCRIRHRMDFSRFVWAVPFGEGLLAKVVPGSDGYVGSGVLRTV